jgi:serine/threonine protein kinase
MVVLMKRENVREDVTIISAHDKRDEIFPEIEGIIREMADADVIKSHPFRDNYTFEKKLGEGTFGVVRECIEIDTQEIVAAKMFKLVTREDGIFIAMQEPHIQAYVNFGYRMYQEFCNLVEVCTLFKLGKHPHIIEMRAVVFDDFSSKLVPRIYMVMERANDLSLYHVIAKKYALIETDDVCFKVLQQITSAVAYIHSKGYMHRDITTSNILVFGNTREDVVFKLSDFGMCYDENTKCQARSINVQNMLCRSPEVAFEYDKYTNAIDIWSLGTVFYHVLTGGLIFDMDIKHVNVDLIVRMILQLGPIPPHLAGGKLPMYWKYKSDIEVAERVYMQNTIKIEGLSEWPEMIPLFNKMMNYDFELRPTAAQVASELAKMEILIK